MERAEPEDDQSRPTVTLRALGLFLVLLVAFVVLAPTLRHGVAQQEQLRRLRADVEAAQQRNDELSAEVQRWNDPAYVQAQARDRLGYTMPGERVYRLVNEPGLDVSSPDPDDNDLVRVPEGESTPWYLTVWDSIEIAGAAPEGSVPDPQSTP